MLKKYFKIILSLFFRTLFIAVFLWWNLEANKVYYYQQSNLTDKAGAPFVLLDQLWWHIENWNEADGDYFYSTESFNYISYYHKSDTENEYRFILMPDQLFSYELKYEKSASNGGDATYYEFNEKYQLVKKSNNALIDIPVTDEDRQFAKEAVNQTVSQLLKRVEEPLFNLQSFYDWTLSGNRTQKIWSLAFVLACLSRLVAYGYRMAFPKRQKRYLFRKKESIVDD
ncbi:hypothetical protein [Streptococcus sp. sy004]|uniref:hypothetical protein n=1 Tax=Streptococcus sp. sy004 TaxID=2600149 RepID=UPI0011B54655|nr:hypothetical protein [Streptococcus sp. sy004]TWT10494.1 hypothetical protein FRX54_04995 [Streptococcus sp. sy004]